jgi:hypothetical protein
LVKLDSREADSAAFEHFVLTALPVVTTSRIALYEARATFQRKEAEGIIFAGTAQKLYTEMLQDIGAGEVRLVELSAETEHEYGQVLSLCYQHNPPILVRTLDALHLASARVATQTVVVATDKRMRDAAKLLGFSLFPV